MNIPERVNATWLATLGNDQLIEAESVLHAEFSAQETAEKRKRGSKYMTLQGPTTLMAAWLRWSLVSNETRSRKLVVLHRK